MSVPILHHYIPDFYLRRFADDESWIIAFRRSMQKSFPTSPKVIAAETHFYTVIDSSGRKSPKVEKYLAGIEGTASQIMRQIDESNTPPTGQDRKSLSHFLALLYTRTREMRHVAEEFARFETAFRRQGLTRESLSSYLRSEHRREPTEAEIDEAVEAIMADTKEPSRDDMVRMMLRTADQIRPAIDDLQYWHLLVSKEQPRYLTSDHPIVLWRTPTPANRLRGIGWRSCEEVYFPLDPHKALVLRREDPGLPPAIEVSAEVVEQVNYLVAHGSYEWIFHHPEHTPLKNMDLPPKRPLFYMGDVPAYGDGQGMEAFLREMEPFSPVVFEREHGEDQNEHPSRLARMKAFFHRLLPR